MKGNLKVSKHVAMPGCYLKTLVMGLTREACATPGLTSELGPFADAGMAAVYGKIGLPSSPSAVSGYCGLTWMRRLQHRKPTDR
jgi:hypothetical protein